MAETIKQNGFFSGTNGVLWWNGEKLAELSGYQCKATGSFDDVNCCGAYETYQQYHGYKVAGTIKIHKVDSKIGRQMLKAYTTGIMPDITLTSKLNNPSTGATERVAVRDVVVSEFVAAMFDAKSIVDEEFPFSGTKMEYLEVV